MSPYAPVDYHRDVRTPDAVPMSQLVLLGSQLVLASNLLYLCGLQPTHRMAFSDVAGRPRMPPTYLTVPHVVTVGAELQMAGIHAAGVVARMEDVDARRDGSVRQFPRDPVRRLIPAGDDEASVTEPEPASLPFPALPLVADSYFCPETAPDVHINTIAQVSPG